MVTFTQFEEQILIALYQEHVLFDVDEVVLFRKIVEKYGLEAKPGWLFSAFKDLIDRGMATGPKNALNDDMAIAKITGRGMRHIEERYSAKDGIALMLEPVDSSTKAVSFPASDRRVSISHNEYIKVEPALSDLVEHLDRDNGLPDDPTFRQRVIGQIRAGRELLRSGEIKLYVLQITLFAALNELIDRYKDTVISGLAVALLDHLLSPSLGLK